MVGLHHEHFEAVMLHGGSREVLVSNQPLDITEMIATSDDDDDDNNNNLHYYNEEEEDFIYNNMISKARKQKHHIIKDDNDGNDKAGGGAVMGAPCKSRGELNASPSSSSWRNTDDPSQQSSLPQPDWTIHIMVKNDACTRDPAYHVHRSVVAFGPRRSAFLARTMTKSRRRSNHHQQSPRSVVTTSPTTITTTDHHSVDTTTCPSEMMQSSSNSKNNNKKNSNSDNHLVSSVTSGLFRILSRSSCSDVVVSSSVVAGAGAGAAPDYSDLVDDDGFPFPTSTSSTYSYNNSSAGSCTSSKSNCSRNSNNSSTTTRLQLGPRLAQVVPIALEYMYSTSSSSSQLEALGVHTDNATALYTLAELWEIKSLCRKVKAYIQDDLNMDNLVTYYQHAMELQDNNNVVAIILNACEEYCAQHIFKVDEEMGLKILKVIDPLFFLRVVTSRYIYQHRHHHHQSSRKKKKNNNNNNEEEEEEYKDESVEQTSMRLSLLISVYGNMHKAELTPLLLAELTNVSHLPVMEATAAKALLQLEDEVMICSSNHGNGNNTADAAVTATASSSLQERAIVVLSQKWMDACFITVPNKNDKNKTANNNTGTTSHDSKNKSGLSFAGTLAAASTEITTVDNMNQNDNDATIVVSLPRLSSEQAMRKFTTQLVQNARQQILARDDELQSLRKFYKERRAYESKLRQELLLAQQHCRQAQEQCQLLEQELLSMQQAGDGGGRHREQQQQLESSFQKQQQQQQQHETDKQQVESFLHKMDKNAVVNDEKQECSRPKNMKRSSSSAKKTTFKQRISSKWWKSMRSSS